MPHDGCRQGHQRHVLVDLPCERIQADEQWAFVHARPGNLPEHLKGKTGYGDVFTWTAMCADTRTIVSWLVGGRDMRYANWFLEDLASRLTNRVQFTTDGYPHYKTAVRKTFGSDVDFAQVVKDFGHASPDRRYSPPDCIGMKKIKVTGNPDPAHMSTSYVERYHLTARMSMRRMTRLTNGYSKKMANLEAAIGIQTMVYNFARKHYTLGTSPAVKIGIANHVWTLKEVVGLLG